METATTPQLRRVALIGHSGAGKTTLAEALLHRAGAIPRPGRVEDGSTVLDHEPEEIARGISVGLGIASFDWTTPAGVACRVTLLDAPGAPDFAGALDAALAAADLAVLVVSAVGGVQAGTLAGWHAAVAAGVPRMVVVSQEDRPRADFHAVLTQLRAELGDGLVPLELPLGEEQDLRGLADVLAEQAMRYGTDGRCEAQPMPGDLTAEEHRLHEEVTEEIVAHDDDELERYLAGEVPDVAALTRALAREVRDGLAVPVLLVSALTGVGVDRLADVLCAVGPSPADHPATVLVAGEPTTVPADPAGEPLLHVFRTVADPFVGQVSVFRVLSGTVTSGDHLVNTTTHTEERLHGLFRVQGRDHLPVERVVAGEIAAAAKLVATPTRSLLAARDLPVGLPAAPDRPAVYALALAPVSQADDDKLSAALARLCAEDPTLRVDRVGDQTVLRGLGDTHLAVALEKLARTFGVHVRTGPVRVQYRETAAGSAEAEGKLKKQSGGHGQYAVVQLRVSALPRGAGFEFVDSVVGGAVPRNFIPAVERGIVEAMAAGGPHGYPLVDLRVELYDGKYHPVDSSEMAFRTAAAHGLREALASAGTVVLEPVSRLTVTVPAACQGDVMGDLSTRRGHIVTTAALDDGRARIEAAVPEAELSRYVLDLRALTGGRGEFTVEPLRYDVLPGHLVPA